MEIMKLVVAGPVGAGKTTFIQSVSEIDTVNTERRATGKTALLKKSTTVGFDFGRLQFGDSMALHLYGTPGQARFDFMWEDLINRAHAYILLVPAHRPAAFRKAYLIHQFMAKQVLLPMIIGITHLDRDNAWSCDHVANAIGFTDKTSCPPFVALNARDPESVALALSVLVDQYIKSHRLSAT